MNRTAWRWSLLALGLAMFAAPVASAQITLDRINSYARNAPFGLAFDGSNLWWTDDQGTAHEMSLTGLETGNSVAMPGGWSALAYDASRGELVSKGISSGVISWFSKSTGATSLSITAPPSGFSLIDGLDVENGELWYSPDISPVFRYAIDYVNAALTPIDAQPVIMGMNSGVERISAGGNDYIVTVDDGSSPRKLCVYHLDYSLIGCSEFSNDRYEDLAFDGRYLWAADYYGNKIDQYDILGDNGGSIISAAPEPATLTLFATGLIGTFGLVRRRRGMITES
jgi:hypothetical protein